MNIFTCVVGRVPIPIPKKTVPEGAGAFRPLKSGMEIEAFRPGFLQICAPS